jgi:hypothetical protein
MPWVDATKTWRLPKVRQLRIEYEGTLYRVTGRGNGRKRSFTLEHSPSLSLARRGVAPALHRATTRLSSVRFRRGAYLLRSYIRCSPQSAGDFGFVFRPVIIRIHADVCLNECSGVTPEVSRMPSPNAWPLAVTTMTLCSAPVLAPDSAQWSSSVCSFSASNRTRSSVAH